MSRALNPRNSEPLTEAQSALAAEHHRLPAYFARRMTRQCPWLLEGATDAGIDALIRAAREFDPGDGFRFTTFAGCCIRRQIIAHFKSLGRMRRKPPGEVRSIDAGDWSADEPSVPPRLGDDAPGFEAILATLPPSQGLVLQLRYRDGMTLRAIGQVMGGITRERVRQVEAKALDALRRRLEAEESPRCVPPPGPSAGSPWM